MSPRRLHLAMVPALLAGLAAAAPAGAQTPTYEIRVKGGHVTALGDWRPLRKPTIADATAVFGPTASREPRGGNACDVRWATPGLRVVFADFGGGTGDPCSDTRGKAQTFATRDRAFATTRGLRPTMEGRQIFRRHPRTDPHPYYYWLYKARLPGSVGASPILKLAFTADKQRIKVFKGYIGAAGT